MPSQQGRAYGLTVFCPIKAGKPENDHRSYAMRVREELDKIDRTNKDLMARVPNTYLCRLFVLDNVLYEEHPAGLDRLKSQYLVFVVDLHGDVDVYLKGMWNAIGETVKSIWQNCVAFDAADAEQFLRYIKRCQVRTTFYFNGSTDDPLCEQLKALYLKQEFSKFAFATQGLEPAALQAAFKDFVARTRPDSLDEPTWPAGADAADEAAVPSGNSS